MAAMKEKIIVFYEQLFVQQQQVVWEELFLLRVNSEKLAELLAASHKQAFKLAEPTQLLLQKCAQFLSDDNVIRKINSIQVW